MESALDHVFSLDHSFILPVSFRRCQAPGKQSPSTLNVMAVSMVSLRMLIGQIMICTLGPNKIHEPSGISFLCFRRNPLAVMGWCCSRTAGMLGALGDLA